MKAAWQWEQFMNSGRISDYLAFKEKEREEDVTKERGTCFIEGRGSGGEGFYAGFYYGDRHGHKGGSCR